MVVGDTTVTGTVFYDECKDGQFDAQDYPLGGEDISDIKKTRCLDA
ncbi:hypothetical protein Hanom_Chr06g00562611 [Helianthus anomalus]